MHYLIVTLIAILTCSLAVAQETLIDADILLYYQNDDYAHYQGDVVIVNGKETLTSDEAKVYFSRKDNKRTLDRIEVYGHVQFHNPEQDAFGDQGFYYLNSDTLELIGDVKLIKGNNSILGEKLVYYRKIGKAVVTPKKGDRIKCKIRD
jgi:lipopolysaccharide export system protein LptA